MRKGVKKKDQQHAAQRALERFGIRYSQFVRDSLIHAIRDGRASLIYRISNNFTVLRVPYTVREQDIESLTMRPGEIKIPVIYDKSRKEIRTILTEEMVLKDIYEYSQKSQEGI